MATRDVQLIVRARDEASRALASVAEQIERLGVKQTGTAATGTSLSASITQVVTDMAKMERATGLVVAAADRSEQAIARQRSALVETQRELAAVERQILNARAAIERGESRLVDTKLAGDDTTKQVAALKAAEAELVNLERVQGRLTRDAAQQEAVIGRNERAYRELASSANTAEAALKTFGDEGERGSLAAAAAAEQASVALREQARAAREAAEQQQAAARFSDFLGVSADPRGSRAAQSAEVFEEARRSEEALRRLQDRIDPLAAVHRRLAGDTQLVKKAFEQGKISADQMRVAIDKLEAEASAAEETITRVGKGERGRPSLFGLKPYELTNLGYQVNDVVTGLASGQKPMQILAQQGGQILQLLPQIGTRLIALFTNPYFLGAAAVFGVIAVAVKKTSDEAERLRKVEGMLEGLADGADTSAAELSKVVYEMERVGLSAEEALAATREFLTQGLDTAYLLAFTKTARDMADVTGEEVPDALGKLTTAFAGGYRAIADLDDSLHFLTVEERELIRTLFESGRASEAREKAAALVERRLDEHARKANGPWKNATRSLERGFGDLFDTLARTDWAESLVGTIEIALEGLDDALTKIEDLSLEQVERKLEELRKVRQEHPLEPGTQVVTLFGDTIDEEIAALERQREALIRNRNERGDTLDAESAARRKIESDLLREIERENQLANARDAASRVAIRGEEAYRKALEDTGSERVAQARKEQEIARARREEAQRAEQERKRRDADFARGIENNGRAGLVGTAQRFAGLNENRGGDSAVLRDLFKAANVDIDPKMIAWCAAFVNAVLATNGLPTVDQATGGSDLRARDFLAYGSKVAQPEAGDIVILKRGGGGHVGFFQGFTDGGDVRVLGGNQSDGVNTQTFAREDVLGFRRAPSLADVAEDDLKLQQQRVEKQAELNRRIDEENQQRRLNTVFMREQIGLSGEALLDAQREQAVLEAMAAVHAQLIKDGTTLDETRLRAIEETVRAEFDIAHARERATAALTGAQGERAALIERLELAQRLGDPALVAGTEEAIRRIDDVLRGAVEKAIALHKELFGDTPETRAAITGLENLLDQIGVEQRDRGAAQVDRPVQQLQALRNQLQEQIDFFQNQGQVATVEQLREQLAALDGDLLRAIDTALEWWKTQTGPEAQAAILQYENLRNQVLAARDEFVVTAGQIQDAFAGAMTNAVRGFSEDIAAGEDAIESLARAAQTFAADFLERLAALGLEMLAFRLATQIGFGGFAEGFSGLLGGGKQLQTAALALTASGAALTGAGAVMTGAGGVLTASAAAWAATAGAIAGAAGLLMAANTVGSAGMFHAGGIAGQAGRSRSVHPAWFAAAFRYHSGGIAGFRPNEVPAILQRGEEILTRADPRHRFNASGSDGGGPTNVNLKAVLVHDPAEALDAALGSPAGEKVAIGFFRRNSAAINAALDG